MSTKKPFIYNYKQHRNPFLSIASLDAIAKIIIEPKQGYLPKIVASIKLMLVVAWLIARQILIKNEMQIAKQLYEQERDTNNQNQVEEEDLV
jgi:mannitol-specific phosphotransferase system IIBC component